MPERGSSIVYLIKSVAALFGSLPLSVSLWLGRRLGWIYGSVVRYHRADANEALQRAFPAWNAARRRRTIRRMYANLGMNTAESFRLAHGKYEEMQEHVRMIGEEHIRAALDTGKGAIILSAHTGNWELMGIDGPQRGYSLTVIAKELKHDALNKFWVGTRNRYGLHIAPVRSSMRICLKALQQNGLIGFMLDQNMIDKEGVFVDFFGRPACTTPGLAFMAAQAGVPVIPAFSLRKDTYYHEIHVQPALEPPTDKKPETIQAATAAYTRIIEDFIREHPEQWIWIHRRWRTEPVDADGSP